MMTPTEAAVFLATMPYVRARWVIVPSAPKRNRVIVVHCTVTGEGPRVAESVQRGFASPTARKGSTQAIVDSDSAVRSVLDEHIAYGAGGANTDGLHLELCGMHDQTREQWLDEVSLATLQQGAKVVAAWCLVYGIAPELVLDPAEVRRRRAAGELGGITSHAAIEKAFPSTGHTDPGEHFPWDVFLGLVLDHYGATAPIPEESNMVRVQLHPRFAEVVGGRSPFFEVVGGDVPVVLAWRDLTLEITGLPIDMAVGPNGTVYGLSRMVTDRVTGGFLSHDGAFVVVTTEHGSTYEIPTGRTNPVPDVVLSSADFDAVADLIARRIANG